MPRMHLTPEKTVEVKSWVSKKLEDMYVQIVVANSMLLETSY